jgi:hypothetical protein
VLHELEEDLGPERGTLPPDGVGTHRQRPVHPDPAGAPLGVPAAGTDGVPASVAVVVAARQQEADVGLRVVLRAADDHEGAVLAAGVVLLVGDPGPDDLARVRFVVVLRCVLGHDSTAEVAGAAAFGSYVGHVATLGAVPRAHDPEDVTTR